VLFTCLGSPGKPVVDTVGPAAAAGRRPAAAVLRRPVGQRHRRGITEQLASTRSPTRCPSWSSRRCATAAPKSDNVSVLAMEWESAEDSDLASRHSTQTLGEEVFASTIQASVIGQDVPDELDDAEIERSIKEINEAIRRSSQKKS
jgi:hypothetical protein